MLRIGFIFLLLFGYTSCTNEITESDDMVISERNTPIELSTDTTVSNRDTSVTNTPVLIPKYLTGSFYKKLEKGSITLHIRRLSDSTCRFVFDTGPGTNVFAKLAGDLLVDHSGKATFQKAGCQGLSFHFTSSGVSVKEFNCDQFRSNSTTFDGIYVAGKPLHDDINVVLKDLVEGRQKFDFYANFTEPFWTIYIIGNDLIFDRADGEAQRFVLAESFKSNVSFQELFFEDKKEAYKLQIEKGDGSDGMSDIVYPYRVVLNKMWHGGGGTEYIHEVYAE